MPTIEETADRIMKVATKKPLKGAEIAEKLNKKYPKAEKPYSGRGIGRALGATVAAGKLEKVGPKSAPSYQKV